MSSVLLFFTVFTNLVQTDSASPWPFQHVDKNAKLSNSAITSVYMDKFDHIWLGTWDGLDRYDGSTIHVYKPDPFVKGSISNNVVRNFLEDHHHNLWIITHQGINKYNRITDTFQSYFDNLDDIPFLENNIRACIGPDSAIWVSLLGKGISHYNNKDSKFIPVNFQGVDSSWLKGVVDLGHRERLLYLLGSDGKIVCTVDNRLVYSKKLVIQNQLTFHKFVYIGKHYFLALVTDHRQLLLYDLADIEKGPATVALGNVIVSTLSENLHHTALWLGSEAGDILKVTLSGTELLLTKMNSYFPMFSKARIKILTITETAQDILWIGTDGDGVYKFLTKPKIFYSLLEGQPENGQLSHSIIRSVYEDTDGTLYIGTRGGGLNIIDPKNGKTKIINSRNGLSNNAVLAINKDHAGNMWFGVDGEGIDMMEAKTNKIFHFPRDFENKNDLSFSSVYSICIDAFNDIWLGTSGYGIIHMKVSTPNHGNYFLREHDQISHSLEKKISLQSNIVYSIVEEKPNTLWFGTRGGGIYRYNSLAKKIESHIQANPNDKDRLCNNDVLSLYIDKHEQLWIGTSGGLNRLYLQNKPYRIQHYTQQEGLLNNTIHDIVEDSKSNIWLSTNHGLVMYSQRKNTFKDFDTNDGLHNNEFTDGGAYKSRISDKLFFGGIDGLDIVYPANLNTFNYFPKLIVTEFQLRNVPVTPGDATNILTNNIEFTDSITLHYDQNFISFFFTTLDYWNKQKSQYAYFLENFDKDWNYIGQQQSVTLTNIPPGSYKLNIKYANENGVWSATPKVIYLTITPPFWRTYWAYGFYLILAIALQIGIVLIIRQRAKTKRAFAIDKFKAGQLKELNDYKLQFFTNIAHEFRTPLTLIMGPVTSLLSKSHDGVEKKQLNTIYSNSIRLQKLIEELMQFRKIESGKESLEISPVDLVPFTQKIIESFQQHANERDIHLEFYPEPEILPAHIDHNKVEKILINLISNAIKYSSAGGMVSVAVSELNGNARFIIKDDGIGITAENKDKIFESFYHNPDQLTDKNGFAKSTGIGLSLTKSLILVHGGKVSVESNPGKGSIFTVTIPISKEYYKGLPAKGATLKTESNLAENVSLEFDTDHYIESTASDVHNSLSNKHDYAILVVDDNSQIVSLLENMLSDKYVVYKARNGKKALTVLENERIDLVISDVLMPDMDGLTLCKTIKENIQTSHIPVILLTARTEIEDRIEGLQVGADSYIPKPFHPEHLFIRIEKLIERMEMFRKKFTTTSDIELAHMSTGIGERDDDFFLKITSCIHQHLNDPEFNADTISEDVGMSKASLYKKVKTITGLTPHGLIKQFRLKKAADLLKNSKLSVSEVIYETGFNSRSYFYKSFNEMFHCHPKDFGQARE